MSDRGARRAISVAALGTVDLPARRADAYEAVAAYPCRTALELEALTGHRRISSRLLELEDAALVEACGERRDEKTGRHASVWRVVENPRAVEPRQRRASAVELRRQLETERRLRQLAESERDQARALVTEGEK
jgi:hypothetical protein